MAVEIIVTTNQRRPQYLEKKACLWFNDDGYYWFLAPAFERVYQQTGRRIDLYGDAVFSGDDLLVLRSAIHETISQVKNRPEAWMVQIGTQIQPKTEQIYAQVNRATCLELLDHFDRMIQRAIQARESLICTGD